MICVQSSVQAHPQSGFSNWQNMLHSQLKPKLVLRNPTHGEVVFANQHLRVFIALMTIEDRKEFARIQKPAFIPTGLNHLKINPYVYTNPHGTTTIQLKASMVRLDRNGDESTLTREFTMREYSFWY